MAAGESSAACAEQLYDPGVILKWPGLPGKNLCNSIQVGGQQKKDGQPQARGTVQAPVKEWYKQEKEKGFSEQGKYFKGHIQLRAELLKPEDHPDAVIQKTLHGLPLITGYF